jgi:hypothetical protein
MRWNECRGLDAGRQLIQLLRTISPNNSACQWFGGVFYDGPAGGTNRLELLGKKAPKSVIRTIDSARDLA